MILRTVLPLFLLTASLSPFASAAPPEGYQWHAYAPMSDEFDSPQIDNSKWWKRNPRWEGRPPVFFHPDCVAVKDGHLRLSALPSSESAKRNLPEKFTHISGYLRSKAQARFGYFEVRAKLMNAHLVSCFWMSHHARDEWSEIDCVEIPAGVPEHRHVFRPNTHYFYGPHYKGTLEKHLVNPKKIELSFDPTADFHTYGFFWDQNEIAWYVDDVEVRRIKNTHFFQPLIMSINVEANSFFKALPKDHELPGTYQIDWVRSWRLEPS